MADSKVAHSPPARKFVCSLPWGCQAGGGHRDSLIRCHGRVRPPWECEIEAQKRVSKSVTSVQDRVPVHHFGHPVCGPESCLPGLLVTR